MIEVSEHYVGGHYRILKVDGEGFRLYSIDVYAKLHREPQSCDEEISVGEVKLCYVKTGLCEAVFSIVQDSAELVNLRLHTTPLEDPAGGSHVKAGELCLSEALKTFGEGLGEVLRPTLGG
ncbi:MAG: hypothetical protein P3X22_004920 [Thermoprotei archaeon]|nr:hypothetical protein [Thermoprotei archaeon]